jgi:hypothetical protein
MKFAVWTKLSERIAGIFEYIVNRQAQSTNIIGTYDSLISGLPGNTLISGIIERNYA